MSARKTADGIGAHFRLVVGLGNPGKDYQNTRHNVGFEIVEEVARRSGARWSAEKKWEADVARIGAGWLVKPQTFMNLSGRAVAAICHFHKVDASEILVVYDDVALAPGRLRLRASGSAAGHKGVKSIIQSLGTENFARLKFGIGRAADMASRDKKEAEGGELTSHVLGKFSCVEREELEKRVARAADAVNYALAHGLAAAMNNYNEPPESGQIKEKVEPAVDANARDIRQLDSANQESGKLEI
jgi:PTH1 family peptidyl-tRNA hydrolase